MIKGGSIWINLIVFFFILIRLTVRSKSRDRDTSHFADIQNNLYKHGLSVWKKQEHKLTNFSTTKKFSFYRNVSFYAITVIPKHTVTFFTLIIKTTFINFSDFLNFSCSVNMIYTTNRDIDLENNLHSLPKLRFCLPSKWYKNKNCENTFVKLLWSKFNIAILQIWL